MWLAVLSAWASLLTLVACQSCSEDSASWVRLKPLGQCGDGDTTCPYRIIIPHLTVQLPKPYRDLEKMAQELQSLTQLVNQLKEDCQACKERQCLQWNIQTGDARKEEIIQASRGTLNTKDRQQDIFRRVTPPKSTEIRPVSSGHKGINSTAMEKQRSSSGLDKNMDPGITRQNKETRGGPLEFNPHQKKRITMSMSDVAARPSFTDDEREDHNSQQDVNQEGQEPTQHEKHNYPGETLTEQGTLKSIPDISVVTMVSEYDFKTQQLGTPENIGNIFRERQPENGMKAQKHMTEPTILDNMKDKKEVSDHVHDATHQDSNPLTFDSIYVNVAKEGSASAIQQPTFNDKDRTEKKNHSASHTEPGPFKHHTDAGTGIGVELNPADTVSGLDILRTSFSSKADNTVDVNPANPQKLDKTSERLFNHRTGAVTDVGINSNPINTAGTVRLETLRSSNSNPPILNRVNGPTKRGQITSQIMRINLKKTFKPGTDEEMDSVMDPSALNTPETGSGLETSKSPIFRVLDKTLGVRQINQEAMDSISENPFKPNTEAETGSETDSNPVHRVTPVSELEMSRAPNSERTGAVDQEASVKPHPSGLVPGNSPAVDKTTSGMTLPSGPLPANNPSVNQNPSGMPKRITMSHPREFRPAKNPAVNQNSRGKYRHSGLLPFRASLTEQNATGITQPSGLLPMRTPVKQETRRILRPSGLLPVRLESNRTITIPNHMTQSERTNSSRFILAKSPTQRRPNIRQRLQGNPSVEAQNLSGESGHTLHISDGIKHDHLKTSTQNNPNSTAGHSLRTMLKTQGIVDQAHEAKHNVSAVADALHPVANQQAEKITENTDTRQVLVSEHQNPEGNREQDQVTNGVRENSVETFINKNTASHDSNNNSGRDAQPPVVEEIKDSDRAEEIPRFQASNNENNKKRLGVERRQKIPFTVDGTSSDKEELNLPTTADNLNIKQINNIKEKDTKMTQFTTPTVTTPYFTHQDHGETDETIFGVIVSDKLRNPSQESESESSAEKRSNDGNPGNKEIDPMLHNTSNVGGSNRGAVSQANSVNSIQDRTMNPNLSVKIRVEDSTRTNVSTPTTTRTTQNRVNGITETKVSTPSLEKTTTQKEAKDPNLSVKIRVGDSTKTNVSTPTMTRATQSQDSNRVNSITETKVSTPSLEKTTIQNKANDPKLILEKVMDSTGTVLRFKKVLNPSITSTAQNLRDSNPVVTDRVSDSTETMGSNPSPGNPRDSKPAVMNKASASAGTPLMTQTATQNRDNDPKLVSDRVVDNTGSKVSTQSLGETNIQGGAVDPKSITMGRIKDTTRTSSVPSTEEPTTQNKANDPVFTDRVKESKGITPSSALSPDTSHKSLPRVESFEDKHGDNHEGTALKDNDENVYPVSERDKPPKDCSDFTMRNPRSGVYSVTPNTTTFRVFCDMKSSGGDWTLIQHRLNGSVSFNRNWDDYKMGFGSLTGEFWLGNDKIHWLTAAKAMVLRVELEDLDGIKKYGQYDRFYVADESQHYRLTIGGYSGTAGNAMQYSKKFTHNQKNFSTPDRDNDQYSSGNCGAFYTSGWWFDACMAANLNGKYYQTRYKGKRNGIFWGTWHNISTESYPTNERQAFKTVRMMIKPIG